MWRCSISSRVVPCAQSHDRRGKRAVWVWEWVCVFVSFCSGKKMGDVIGFIHKCGDLSGDTMNIYQPHQVPDSLASGWNCSFMSLSSDITNCMKMSLRGCFEISFYFSFMCNRKTSGSSIEFTQTGTSRSAGPAARQKAHMGGASGPSGKPSCCVCIPSAPPAHVQVGNKYLPTG